MFCAVYQQERCDIYAGNVICTNSNNEETTTNWNILAVEFLVKVNSDRNINVYFNILENGSALVFSINLPTRPYRFLHAFARSAPKLWRLNVETEFYCLLLATREALLSGSWKLHHRRRSQHQRRILKIFQSRCIHLKFLHSICFIYRNDIFQICAVLMLHIPFICQRV